jgi:3-hydroxyisobutyrate dehydrogenase
MLTIPPDTCITYVFIEAHSLTTDGALVTVVSTRNEIASRITQKRIDRENEMKIGFIGAGRMGYRMIENLVRGGHTVEVYDQSSAASASAASKGAIAVNSIKAVATGKDLVLTMLPVPKASIDVYCGKDGLIASASSSTTIVECSTVDVDTIDTIYAAAQAAGVSFVDAPLTGGIQGAQAGTLTFMVGATAEQFDFLMPALKSMGRKFVHVGPVGSGTKMKLINQMINASNLLAASEALWLGKRLGLDSKKMYEVLSSGTANSWVLNAYFPLADVVPDVPANRKFQDATFPAFLMVKDTQCAMRSAQKVGFPTPINSLAASLVQLYCMKFDETLDWSAVSMLFNEDGKSATSAPTNT